MKTFFFFSPPTASHGAAASQTVNRAPTLTPSWSDAGGAIMPAGPAWVREPVAADTSTSVCPWAQDLGAPASGPTPRPHPLDAREAGALAEHRGVTAGQGGGGVCRARWGRRGSGGGRMAVTEVQHREGPRCHRTGQRFTW